MLSLAQATGTSAASALTSTALILSATFAVVAMLKQLLPTVIVGRGTLLASLVISLGLTLVAMFGSKTIPADLSGFLAVLMGLLGAAGIDASGRAVMASKAKPPLGLLVPLGLAVCLSGCSTMSPSQRYAFSSNGFAATVDQVATLIEFGVIDDSKLDDIQIIAHQIDAEFDAWDEALRNDIPLDSRFVLARVERLLGRLVQYQLDAEGVSYGPDHSDRVGYRGNQGGGEGHGPGQASPGRAARPDASGAGRGEGDPQGVGVEPGQRDQLAAQLRGLTRRHAGLTAVASR